MSVMKNYISFSKITSNLQYTSQLNCLTMDIKRNPIFELKLKNKICSQMHKATYLFKTINFCHLNIDFPVDGNLWSWLFQCVPTHVLCWTQHTTGTRIDFTTLEDNRHCCLLTFYWLKLWCVLKWISRIIFEK